MKNRMLKSKIKSADIVYKLFRFVLLIGICYLFLFPILYMVSLALRHPLTVDDPSIIWLPKEISFESISKSAELMKYKDSFLLTFLITSLSTVGTVVSCSLVGYGLSRFEFKAKKFLFALVVLMIVVPPQLLMIPEFLNYRYFTIGGLLTLLKPITGIANINLVEGNSAALTFILPAMFASGLRAGFFIFIFFQFFKGMHTELEEAARIDGCNSFQTYYRIAIPLSKPAITTVTLYSIVWHWNEFYTSSVYFLGDVKPLSVMLNNLAESLLNDNSSLVLQSTTLLRTYLAAGSLLTILPLLIFYVFAQRAFVESIENTGLVG